MENSLIKQAYWVIPSFNEDEALLTVVQDLHNAGADTNRIVIVDDGSTKGVLREVGSDITIGAIVLRHLVNLGQGAALQTGIDYARLQGAEYIVTFDADGQHRIADAEKMLAHVSDTGLLCVIGSRFLGATEDMPASRGLTLKLGILFTQFMTGYRFTDVHNGLRVFRSGFFDQFRFHENRMEHASEILEHLARSPQIFEEFPVTIAYSEYSLDKGQGSLNGFKIAFRTILSKFI